MSLYTYTTWHDIKDICMIYEGNWPLKFWNFTDRRYENLRFYGIKHVTDENGTHPTIIFKRVRSRKGTPGIIIRDIRQFRDMATFLPYEYEYAEVVVENGKHPMTFSLSGSTNKPEEKKEINFLVSYKDHEYRKWKRDIFWFLFNIKYKIEMVWYKLFPTKTKKL